MKFCTSWYMAPLHNLGKRSWNHCCEVVGSIYCDHGNKIPQCSLKHNKGNSLGWSLTYPIVIAPGCKLGTQNHAVFLWRLRAATQNIPILDKEQFPDIMFFLLKHRILGSPQNWFTSTSWQIRILHSNHSTQYIEPTKVNIQKQKDFHKKIKKQSDVQQAVSRLVNENLKNSSQHNVQMWKQQWPE